MRPSWHPLQEASTSVFLEGREKRVHPSTVKGEDALIYLSLQLKKAKEEKKLVIV